MTIQEIIQRLRIAMDDAREQDSHFESWLIQNEGICDAIDALKEVLTQLEHSASHVEPVTFDQTVLNEWTKEYKAEADYWKSKHDQLLKSLKKSNAAPVGKVCAMERNENGVFITTVLGSEWIELDTLIYTTPSQRSSSATIRTWVGLTHKDIDKAIEDNQRFGGFRKVGFAYDLEALLKEKNT